MRNLKYILIILILALLTSCAKSSDDTENKSIGELNEERIIEDIREYDKIYPRSPENFMIYTIDHLKEFEEDRKTIILAEVAFMEYSFKDGIFNNESGYVIPMELDYIERDGKYELMEIIQAQDGENYFPSILKMARGDENLADSLSLATVDTSMNDKMMETLKKAAEDKGLKNFTHKLEDIPGYEDNVIYLRGGHRNREDTIDVVKKEDYERSKSQVGKKNWPHCEGIEYHEKTGITQKTIIDYFLE
ncbi:hypothetical protein KQI68_01520 [Peptoniphilus sp. MSJ-1]|uniref:Lipoprotein n=1 Tax=Peptoniphilus ovalis TaxID=2841503 RepID=A0ABS6FEA4_9FIRM|nr:hypothetical protein [Peptoniphilus ovalis]MBU5668511.1 hypothetical protein [Peptoniphilus ovalis]